MDDADTIMNREARAFLRFGDIPIPNYASNIMELYGIVDMETLKMSMKKAKCIHRFIEQLEEFVRVPDGAPSKVDFTLKSTRRKYLPTDTADNQNFVFAPYVKQRLRDLKKSLRRYVQPARFSA